MISQSEMLSQEKAAAIIAPWYSLFNVATRGDVAAIHEQTVTPDYLSCTGDGPGECWGREVSIKVISSFAHSIPDMNFEIKEMLVAGNRVVVRGEVTGTPAGDLYNGVIPYSGKSFCIMALDIQTIEDGRIRKTYHMENWFAAIGQLRRESA